MIEQGSGSGGTAEPPAVEAARPRYRPVARDTVQEQVYRQLKELILDGEIEPGTTVTIQSLADAFAVSAMPVREALHRLIAEKALTIVAGRSVGIAPLNVERLADLRRVRLEVEGLAAAWATGRLPPAQLEALEDLVGRMEIAAAAKDRRAFVPANREFHFAIYRAAGSDTLLAIIESLWLQIGPYFDLLRSSDNWRSANHHHRALLAALRRQDADAARAALCGDIEGAAAILARLVGGETSQIGSEPDDGSGVAGAAAAGSGGRARRLAERQ
jgi:DNA-binding GntR family transcriptional regulator